MGLRAQARLPGGSQGLVVRMGPKAASEADIVMEERVPFGRAGRRSGRVASTGVRGRVSDLGSPVAADRLCRDPVPRAVLCLRRGGGGLCRRECPLPPTPRAVLPSLGCATARLRAVPGHLRRRRRRCRGRCRACAGRSPARPSDSRDGCGAHGAMGFARGDPADAGDSGLRVDLRRAARQRCSRRRWRGDWRERRVAGGARHSRAWSLS